MAMTAPTPMMMPSMVRIERSLLRASARMAIRIMASKSIRHILRSILKLGHVFQSLSCDGPVLYQLVAANRPISKVYAALGEFGDVRLVGHHHDGQSVIIQFLKNVQNLDGRPAVEIAGRFVCQQD